MIVKGIIKTIDFRGNTCTVRIPVLENSANGTEVVIPAVFSMIPGLYNGYKVGDVVFVAFENDQLNSPVVISKLYLGADTESKNPRGAINADSFKATNPITIPVSTKLTLDNDPNKLNTAKVKNGLADFKSISDIIKGLQVQTEQIGSLDVQLVDTGKELGTKVNKTQDAKTTGFGWNLTNDSWTLQAYDSSHGFKYTDILKATKNGVEVTGTIKIKDLPRYTRTTYAITDTKNSGAEPCPIETKPWYYNDDTDKYNDPENPPLEPWSLIEPEQTLGKYLWVATTVWSYTENTTTGELEESVDTTIQEGALLKYTYYYIQVSHGDPAPDLPANNTIPTEESGWATAIPTRDDNKDIYRCTQIPGDNDDPQGTRHLTYTDLTKIEATALVLKQGKSANYYSDDDPHNLGYNVKYGDSWFDTGKSFVRVDKATPEIKNAVSGGTFITKDEYTNYWIDATDLIALQAVQEILRNSQPIPWPTKIEVLDRYEESGFQFLSVKTTWQDESTSNDLFALDDSSSTELIEVWELVDSDPDNTVIMKTTPFSESDFEIKDNKFYILVTASNLSLVSEGTTIAYTQNQGVLRQWVGDHWEDIGGELIANKVTANYINALDITARRIHVLDANQETLFLADADHPEDTQLGGFKITKDEIRTTDFDTNIWLQDQVLLSSTGKQKNVPFGADHTESWSIAAGSNFGVTTDGDLFASNATLNEFVKFIPSIAIGPEGTLDPVILSAEQNYFGTIDISGYITYDEYKGTSGIDASSMSEMYDFLDPNYIVITDPSWGGIIKPGGGGSQGGGSSSGGAGGGGIHITPWDPNSGGGTSIGGL